ncbi:hypothetical protein V8F33_011716 [Rhypophila sp. PSN 637]
MTPGSGGSRCAISSFNVSTPSAISGAPLPARVLPRILTFPAFNNTLPDQHQHHHLLLQLFHPRSLQQRNFLHCLFVPPLPAQPANPPLTEHRMMTGVPLRPDSKMSSSPSSAVLGISYYPPPSGTPSGAGLPHISWGYPEDCTCHRERRQPGKMAPPPSLLRGGETDHLGFGVLVQVEACSSARAPRSLENKLVECIYIPSHTASGRLRALGHGRFVVPSPRLTYHRRRCVCVDRDGVRRDAAITV